MSVKGIIKNVDEYAVHDGPGARSLVFIKGCFLRCKWCQNPELLDPRPEIWFQKHRCVGCGKCQEACPAGAIDLQAEKRIDRTKCRGVECAGCVEVCPAKAYEIVGYEITADELHKWIAKYKWFYDNSKNRKGGVTLSGGEPLYQPEFSAEVLRLCQENSIHTCVESCLYQRYELLWKIVSKCDLLICDVKHMDSKKHKEGTGVSNELILETLKRLCDDYRGEIYVHIPLIPGYNDNKENVAQTLEFLHPLKQVVGVDLLPFNIFPAAKYEALSQDWELEGVKTQTHDYLEKLKRIVDSYNRFQCTIGGKW